MNKTLFLTFFSALTLCAESYFTVDLPENWQKVPTSSLSIYNHAEDALKNEKVGTYSAAYERKALLDFTLPYILVEQEKHVPYSVSELESMAEEMPSIIRQAYLPLHRAGKFGEVKVMPGIYDRERNMVFTYYEMVRAKPREEMFAFTACFPSKLGLVKLHGFGKRSDYEKSMAEMEQILNSFTFGSNYFYTPPLRSSKKLKALPAVCIGAFVLLYALRFIGRCQSGGREPFSKKA